MSFYRIVPVLFALAALLPAQQDDGKLRIIAFGAHPDDCDSRAGGVAAKYAALGHHVKFVAVTSGDAGHLVYLVQQHRIA
jgi:LmbE family N-acetylglucosaminyl deacetylase